MPCCLGYATVYVATDHAGAMAGFCSYVTDHGEEDDTPHARIGLLEVPHRFPVAAQHDMPPSQTVAPIRGAMRRGH